MRGEERRGKGRKERNRKGYQEARSVIYERRRE
jgi:hypothetical protein